MPSNARQAVAPLNIQQLLAAKQMGLGDYIAQAEMRNHVPSLRDRIGNMIYDAAQGAGLKQSAQGMRTNAQTAMDFVPGLGDAIGAEEAGRDIGAGNYLSGGLGLAATLIPGAIAEKGVRTAAKKGIKAFHGSRSGPIRGGFRPNWHDETSLRGVAFSTDRRVADRYARNIYGRGDPSDTIIPHIVEADIEVDNLPKISDFYDDVEKHYGRDLIKISPEEVHAYAKSRGIKALDTSAIGEKGEVFVLDPAVIKNRDGGQAQGEI